MNRSCLRKSSFRTLHLFWCRGLFPKFFYFFERKVVSWKKRESISREKKPHTKRVTQTVNLLKSSLMNFFHLHSDMILFILGHKIAIPFFPYMTFVRSIHTQKRHFLALADLLLSGFSIKLRRPLKFCNILAITRRFLRTQRGNYMRKVVLHSVCVFVSGLSK